MKIGAVQNKKKEGFFFKHLFNWLKKMFALVVPLLPNVPRALMQLCICSGSRGGGAWAC